MGCEFVASSVSGDGFGAGRHSTRDVSERFAFVMVGRKHFALYAHTLQRDPQVRENCGACKQTSPTSYLIPNL